MVHGALLTPGRIVRQVASLPDGETYLFVACAVAKGAGGFRRPRGYASVMLGCDIAHVRELVYGDGVEPGAAVPVGITCRQCPRLDRSEEHTSELQSLMRISYAVFCLKKKKKTPCIQQTKKKQKDNEK